MNIDEFMANVEAKLYNPIDRGQVENALWQHIGKYYNKTLEYGNLFDEMLANVERKIDMKKKHGFEQNKKTRIDKMIEGGKNERLEKDS